MSISKTKKDFKKIFYLIPLALVGVLGYVLEKLDSGNSVQDNSILPSLFADVSSCVNNGCVGTDSCGLGGSGGSGACGSDACGSAGGCASSSCDTGGSSCTC